MRKCFVLVFSLLMLAMTACSGDNGKQQLETAQFEEKQNNKEHAVKLYEVVVSKYPGSANAKTAQERLNVLKGNK
jgi:outer membrane protein assembly factor BamD (BamD/ComL family)